MVRLQGPFRAAGGLMLAAAVVVGCAEQGQDAERWYTDEQVVRGEALFQQYCAQCHGVGGEGAEDWRQRDAQGRTGPPPLNGTGHAWHHARAELRHFILYGLGPGMPPWRAVLDEEEADAIIAYFQDWWPEDIYQAWLAYDARFRERGVNLGDEPIQDAHGTLPEPGSSAADDEHGHGDD